MSVSRIVRWAAAAAIVTAGALAGPASAAPPAEPPAAPGTQASRFEVPLTGSATFEELGELAFTGTVRVAVSNPADAAAKRIIHTRLGEVVGTGTGVTCEARSAEHFRLAAAETLTFTGTFDLVPPDGTAAGDAAEACWGQHLDVRFTVALGADGKVTGEPTAVVAAEEVPAP
ncbi:hypothetical protein CS0771_51650 [Catellatospora sp. IY07-71]|uniref:hypothetical protein n=1 Tax=Catellatospora sp. IY07-71 TaxID=2728827 RepID=UPI001BB390CA|nr:hypothetical protein [Catellatospora sp. IY07-71]BCJ75621.1 hypothetical protein CS0771_51650 [Catellatospora sp. IY07-71]